MSNKLQIVLEEDVINHFNDVTQSNSEFFISALNSSIAIKPEQSFSVYNAHFKTSFLDIKPIIFFFEKDSNKALTETELHNSINNYIQEYNYNKFPKEFIIKGNEEKPFYLTSRSKGSFEIIGEQVAMQIETIFYLNGEGFQNLFKNLNMTKFINRKYNTPEDFQDKTLDITNFPVVSYKYDTGLLCLSHNIYYDLFKDWVLHQIMKNVFKCSFDPFYEKNGLIHRRTKKHKQLKPIYVLPDNFVEGALNEKLIFCKQHAVNQNLLTEH